MLQSIDKAQNIALGKKVIAGHVRAFELTWARLVNKDSVIVHKSFTDRERGNIKDLIDRFGSDDALLLMKWAVDSWQTLAKLPYLRLPPTPVFSDLYFQRERIWATWKAEEQKREELKEQLAERERVEEERKILSEKPPQKSLSQMVRELRAKSHAENL